MIPTRSEALAWASRAIACAEEHAELGDMAEAEAMYHNARSWLTSDVRPEGIAWTPGQQVIKRSLWMATEQGLVALTRAARKPREGSLR